MNHNILYLAPTLFKYFTTSKCLYSDATFNGVLPLLSFT